MTDEAKAVEAVAKTGQELIKAAGGLGSWLADVVGNVPHDLLGILGGDWISHVRIRNLYRMQVKTAQLLEGVATLRLNDPSPSLVLPLLRTASDETRESLQDLWAALLANTMLDNGQRVRRAFFDVLAQLEPSDAVFLKRMHQMSAAAGYERQNMLTIMQSEGHQPDVSSSFSRQLGPTWVHKLVSVFSDPVRTFVSPGVRSVKGSLIPVPPPKTLDKDTE